jgi:glutamine synthetase
MGRTWPKDSVTRDHCGNGAHFNCSIWDAAGSTNLFVDTSKDDGVSDFLRHWVAGLLKNADAITALLNPTVNCYRRLHGPWAPSHAAWGIDDRYATFRVKNFGGGSSSALTWLENRLPSGLANPYLALAANIAAGLDGVLNKLELPTAASGGGHEKGPRILSDLEESLKALEASTVMRAALGDEFVDYFCCLKREGDIKQLPKSDIAIEDDVEAFKEEVELYGRLM